MPRDPYASLARLRHLDTRAAQARTAEAAARLHARHAAAEAIEAELRHEQPEAAPRTYGDFLARVLAARQQQAAAIARAGALLDAERDALAAAHAGEKVIERLRERRAVAARRDALRRAQTRLEEALPRG